MLEFALHEMILQSEHVTYNPDEADYFFVPIYESCFIWPIHGHNPFPYFFKDGVSIGPGVPLLLLLLLSVQKPKQSSTHLCKIMQNLCGRINALYPKCFNKAFLDVLNLP
jgi:hypothetical protein